MNNSSAAIRSGDRRRYAQGYEPLYSDRPSFRPGPVAPAPWTNVETGAGSIAATAADMALFLRFLLGLAEGRGGPVFSDATAAAFIADPADAPNWSADTQYGNGLARLSVDERTYLHHTGGMVSFSSSMHVDPMAGVAAFASTNVGYRFGYRPRDVTLYACRLLRVAREGGNAPTPGPTRTNVPQPARLTGEYIAASGENFEIVADGADQIAMRRDGGRNRMQSLAGPFFVCADSRFEMTGIRFEAEGEDIVRAWADGVEFARVPHNGYQPPAPPELERLAGIYESDDRWNGPLWVIARAGGVWLNNVERMTLLDDGSFRVGDDEWSPERVRFVGFVAGRPTRMLASGVPYVRRFS
jgi:hypothetical protein